MLCLLKYISIRGCGGESPVSRYVDELAGMDLKGIDSLASHEQKDYLGVWDDVRKRAYITFIEDVRDSLRSRFRVKAPKDKILIPKKLDKSISTAPSVEYRGVVFNSDMVLDSEFLQLFAIPSLYSDSHQSVGVVVVDMNSKDVLYEQTISLNEGWNDVVLPAGFNSESLFIGYESESFTSYEVELGLNNCECSCTYTELTIEGVTLSSEFDVISTSGSTQSIAGKFMSQCSVEKFICCNADQFITAFWYKCGIEMLKERVYTDKCSNYTLFDKDKAKELLTNYLAEYRGGANSDGIEYSGYLNTAIDGISVDCTDCCLETSSFSTEIQPVI